MGLDCRDFSRPHVSLQARLFALELRWGVGGLSKDSELMEVRKCAGDFLCC